MIQIIITTDQRDRNIIKYNLYSEEAQKGFLDWLKNANEDENEGQRAAVNIAYKMDRLVRQEDRSREQKKQKKYELTQETEADIISSNEE